ncbi:hypothetical protein K439DRAFT_1390281 [Ramaria rubella]|nr:hypothetical protein K439DRAFT_1390281 [Ramaria rubella]
MRATFILAIAASFVSAVPSPPARGDTTFITTDTDILNFALTLELVENAFYSRGLEMFDADAFTSSGLPAFARGRFSQLAQHEATHVAFLQQTLGNKATKACNYTFPFSDPPAFSAMSAILENVGDGAYLGASQFIVDKSVLTAAGSIMSTEGRHQAWVNSAVNKQTPWTGSFVTPLSFNQAFSLASPFIVSCPASNPNLGLKAFPALTVSPAAPTPGSTITLTFNQTGNAPTFLALLIGLDTTFLPITNKQVTLPAGLQGFVYAVVVNNKVAVTDASTLAGPAILDFPFNSAASNP